MAGIRVGMHVRVPDRFDMQVCVFVGEGMRRPVQLEEGAIVDGPLLGPAEEQLCLTLASLRGALADALGARAPDRVVDFATRLATDMHRFYHTCPVAGQTTRQGAHARRLTGGRATTGGDHEGGDHLRVPTRPEPRGGGVARRGAGNDGAGTSQGFEPPRETDEGEDGAEANGDNQVGVLEPELGGGRGRTPQSDSDDSDDSDVATGGGGARAVLSRRRARLCFAALTAMDTVLRVLGIRPMQRL
eukprot:GHVU01044715.1.p1 GENE.GHVU01044715.1~~GHVU01044715.1.p1  ORF type:complete len:245 (-),score=33.45 GHVU01044715.1:108-842(-)